MAEQKQILRISSTDNIRYSVLRLLHECLAAVARKGDAQSAIALSKYIFKEFDERDMLLYVETTQYELETRKHVREPIKKGGDDLPPVGHCFLGAAHSGADPPVEEQAVPSAYRHVLCGILHQFGCSDLHCTDGS